MNRNNLELFLFFLYNVIVKEWNMKKVFTLFICCLLLTGCGKGTKAMDVNKKDDTPKEKVDIIDINSKTRPIAIMVNNTPVAVKVQNGVSDAYLVYEVPTEFYTSRLMALYKDAPNT